MEALCALGVDGIITDRPSALVGVLDAGYVAPGADGRRRRPLRARPPERGIGTGVNGPASGAGGGAGTARGARSAPPAVRLLAVVGLLLGPELALVGSFGHSSEILLAAAGPGGHGGRPWRPVTGDRGPRSGHDELAAAGRDVLAAAEVADGFADGPRGSSVGPATTGRWSSPHPLRPHVRDALPHRRRLLRRDLVVVGVARCPRWRMSLPRRRCRTVIEAEAGAFERWGLRGLGDQLDLRRMTSGRPGGRDRRPSPTGGRAARPLRRSGPWWWSAPHRQPRRPVPPGRRRPGAAAVIYCEDTRHSRKLLTHAGITGVALRSLHEHNEDDRIAEVVADVTAGRTVALVSDAGMPGVSDPAAGWWPRSRGRADGHRRPRPVGGAGRPGDQRAGHRPVLLRGLPAPVGPGAQTERLAALAAEVRTTVAVRGPGRVAATLRDLAAACGGERPVAVARELTKLHEEIWRGTLDGGGLGGAQPVRGEVVLVLAGRPRSSRPRT